MISLLLNGPIRELLITAKVCMLLVHSWDYCTVLAVDVVHRHYRLVRFGCPTPLEACLVPSGTLRASPEGKKHSNQFQLRDLWALVWSAFRGAIKGNKSCMFLESLGQPWATTKKRGSYAWCYFLLGGLQLLEDVWSVQMWKFCLSYAYIFIDWCVLKFFR